MNAYVEQQIDFDAINADYTARVTLTSNDWHPGAVADYDAFMHGLYAVADADGFISQNDLRLRFLEDTIDGPRCSIPHHRYSALFSRARKDGLIVVDGLDVCTTSPSGNNGKQQRRYRLRASP